MSLAEKRAALREVVGSEPVDPHAQIVAERERSGRAFEEHVEALLARYGIALGIYRTEREQYEIGESASGIEVKHDRGYARTGNLYIEIAESRHPEMPLVASGIYRRNNTTTWAIGDYQTLFLLPQRLLIEVHESRAHREVWNDSRTSRGYLLPGSVARSMALRIIEEVRP